jgi:spore maturation protein CgeB
MRIFIINTNYPRFLGDLYRSKPELEGQPYADQMRVLEENFIGESPSFARAFEHIGHTAVSVSANNAPLQRAWARENGFASLARGISSARFVLLPRHLVGSLVRRQNTIPFSLLPGLVVGEALKQVLRSQIESFRPDVVLNQDMFLVDRSTLRWIRNRGSWVVGQHAASPLPSSVPLDEYDLLVSSFPPTVEEWRMRGFAAELNRLAFDPAVLKKLPPDPRRSIWPVTFVGSLQTVHRSRLDFLEELAVLVPALRIWTPDAAALTRHSPLRDRLMGTVAGLKMYGILRSSRLTVNHHGDVADSANNMRLFEATGVGTALVTDAKADLSDLFTPGREVLAYSSVEECAELITSTSPALLQQIAAAGQARTLAEHTFVARATELSGLFADRLG